MMMLPLEMILRSTVCRAFELVYMFADQIKNESINSKHTPRTILENHDPFADGHGTPEKPKKPAADGGRYTNKYNVFFYIYI